MIRIKKKSTKMRGTRTCGGGCSKKRRGAGHRGGRGLAGSGKKKKTKWTRTIVTMPYHIGSYGFSRNSNLRKDSSFINVGAIEEQINSLIEKNIAEKKEGKIFVDISKLGISKVCGKGNVKGSYVVTASEFSKKAEEKILSAGGEAVIVGDN
ncbi:MAG: 50S ribosomal protein L15 [Candidatus Methanofastidiosa archaeon]|jgi:large subunit ribosomal protein L15|nr:50S ribosomal protein L15 [Candidatus Methanofastidiosa archaeon]HOM95913.1 uL15 family ribosomal protein [Methanofastidiosum sp.]HPC81406.1 uL15 family ribosomal protein [Methanofastidiosum sp.]HRS26210.1 uL15 family ribosomal protein [Methanofastidiosum sp.]